jgi:S1-C subfamily serine protease
VPQDAVRAHAWLTRALAHNYRPAAELRARLGRAMSAAEVARATRLAHGQVASHVGSGVLIDRAGQVLTAFHLVDGCRQVTTIGKPPRQALTLVGFDLANDLALMKLARPTLAAVPISWETALRGGQAIYHAGVSMNGTEAPRLSFGKGRLRRLQGPNGDRRFIGLAAGMAGNAGGPILDRRGRLIGISLDRPRLMALTGAAETPPGPLHYALNASVLRDFLDYYGVATGVAADAGPVLDDAGAVARLRAVTVGFECRL